jgi:hypothetical protein
VRKSAKVALSILATVAVSACSDSGSDTATSRDCVDNRSNAVVSPDWCTPGHPNYLPVYAWYYGGMMYRRGATSYVRDGTFTAPARGSRSFSRSSPTVSRGVIGGGAKAGG